MVLNHIKERLSLDFFSSIVHREGYTIEKVSEGDYGIDCYLNEITTRVQHGNTRYMPSGRLLHIQFKATTEKNVKDDGTFIKYALEVKSYNDLVHRKNCQLPFVLMLFVLPDDQSKWIRMFNSGMVFKKCLYWFILDDNAKESQNDHSVTINIPRENLFSWKSAEYLLNLIESMR